ncbi:MAG: TatD family hydrolase [Rhizobiales bacterium]|nr:TatD family hydrolase [Hyphomicrobiales bacterium]
MLIDSHCHLDFPEFADQLDAIVARAHNAGVQRMITICTRVEKFPQVLAVANRYDDIFCSVGTHPHNADEELHITAELLIELGNNPKVVALGEAGLDYHYDKASREGQMKGFITHIEAARESGLPLVIHARSADDDMIKVLTEETKKGPFPAVLHCFSSGEKLAMAGVELGLYVSFSGIATFKNAQDIRDVAKKVPKNRMLVETDAPYLAPVPHRGRTNEPAYVADTASSLAQTLEMDVIELISITGSNVFDLFKKLPRTL